MGAVASQITSLTVVYSNAIQTQIKENTKAPRVTGLCAGTGQFPAQMEVTRKMFPFDDVIMNC